MANIWAEMRHFRSCSYEEVQATSWEYFLRKIFSESNRKGRERMKLASIVYLLYARHHETLSILYALLYPQII